MKRPDVFDGLRYYPGFLIIALGLGVGVTILFNVAITRAWVDQRLVPRWHPVTMQPGDWIEVGARGADRPVLVHHPDGSVTNAGQMRGALKYLHHAPAFLATALIWFPLLWVLARVWPREDEGRTAHGA
jgi:hypothetical protein